MIVWLEFMCDRNHSWEFLHDEATDLPPSAARCPVDGTEAVTMGRNVPVGVRVAIVPAARIVDEVTGQVGHMTEYMLEVRPWQGPGSLLSAMMTWDLAVERAQWFKGLTWEQAEARWSKTPLGRRK